MVSWDLDEQPQEGEEGLLRVSLKRNNSEYPMTVQMERYNKIKV